MSDREVMRPAPVDQEQAEPVAVQAEPVAVTWAMVEAAEAAHDAARGNQGGFWRSAVPAMIEAALRAKPQQQAKPAQVFQLDEKSRQAHALLDLTSSRPSSSTWTTPGDEIGNPSF